MIRVPPGENVLSVALASGIAAHLHDRTQAFTLFATHYFELTEFPAKHHCAAAELLHRAVAARC